MTTLAFAATLVGATLGQYFAFSALIPAIFMTITVGFGSWWFGGSTSLVVAVGGIATFVGCLQIGYFLGAAVHRTKRDVRIRKISTSA